MTSMQSEESAWYKDAILYELHVRSFFDSDGDGIGDFQGAAQKLDYLQDLGVNAIWLLPFYPSPLKDDGYDISDYMDVHPAYGNLSDFKHFLKEAHQRGIRVITELVLNHTASEHPWFQRARRSPPNSPHRNFYVWSDSPDKYRSARIIFKDFETSNWTWDPIAKAYYWHRFYSHQPDLNFDNPEVRKAVMRTLDFWAGMGVDGFRLDAVPYLYEREGTNCENLPETHQFLKLLRQHIDSKYKNRLFLAEANQWPEDAVPYFGDGDECHMAFHFPIMPRLFMSVHMEDRNPIIDILEQTPAIPPACQWALFLRNHDELTLEMVTDEERDYMYRVYARDPQARINLGIRNRLAPLLKNHRRKIELLNAILFSLPGTPILYYGDELGMGDNIYLGDRNAVRTPMQWSADRNAGFSRANPQRLYLPVIIDPEYHYETLNVEAQERNPHSILWWMKRLIGLRKKYKALSRGSIHFLAPENRKVLAFIREHQGERVLVVANLSRFVQCVELDLSAFKGMVPVEVFGRTEFPPIGDLPYFLTLAPHTFFWFTLETSQLSTASATAQETLSLRSLSVKDRWDQILTGKNRTVFEDLLSSYLKECRWFGGKSRRIKKTQIHEIVPFSFNDHLTYVLVIRVEYADAEPDHYLLPIAYAAEEKMKTICAACPKATILSVRVEKKGAAAEGVVFDAFFDRDFSIAVLEAIQKHRRIKGSWGEIRALPTRGLRELKAPGETLEPSVMKAEQSNTSILFGNRLILKFFRRFEEGMNPDLEIGRALSEKQKFPNVPALAGSLEYVKKRGESWTLGLLQTFIQNQGDAWSYTLDAVSTYLELVLAKKEGFETKIPDGCGGLLDALKNETVLATAQNLMKEYLEVSRLLGQRTAEMHTALATIGDDPAFNPEPFSFFYQRGVFQSMRNLTSQTMKTLSGALKRLPENIQADAKSILGRQKEILQCFQPMLEAKMTSLRIRAHGDYHLGQVLYTGKDFVIIDFEGEPARSLADRRIKRSPLRDVAGMIRSFHYAAFAAFSSDIKEGVMRTEDVPFIEPWVRFWYVCAASAFLQSYLEHAGKGKFLPESETELKNLLKVFVLEKAVYELNYELNNRPDWVNVPLKGIAQLLEGRDL